MDIQERLNHIQAVKDHEEVQAQKKRQLTSTIDKVYRSQYKSWLNFSILGCVVLAVSIPVGMYLLFHLPWYFTTFLTVVAYMFAPWPSLSTQHSQNKQTISSFFDALVEEFDEPALDLVAQLNYKHIAQSLSGGGYLNDQIQNIIFLTPLITIEGLPSLLKLCATSTLKVNDLQRALDALNAQGASVSELLLLIEEANTQNLTQEDLQRLVALG